MRALRLLTASGISTVAALLGLAACGSPANNNGLFSTTGAPSFSSGGGASESGGGTENSSAGGSSGAASNSSGGAMPSGGVGAASGAGGISASGAPGGGAPNGGAPNGGSPGAGAPNGGSPGAGAPNGGGGSGGMVSECSADGAGATYYSETKHCYLVVRDMATFAEAKAHCASLNAHLVTLSDQQENDFVWSLDTNVHWIGTTDGKGPRENNPGTYTWVDGEPFTYTNWSAGQPNASQATCTDGGGNCYEHCGFQWSGGAVPGEWNDRLCTHMIEAVCEWDQ